MTEVLRGVLGLAVLLAIGIALSQNRGAIRPRVVMSALGLQVAIGVLMLFVRPGRIALEASGSAINQVIAYGNKGMEFMFGGLVGPRMHEVFGDTGSIVADGSHDELLSQGGLYAELWHRQSGGFNPVARTAEFEQATEIGDLDEHPMGVVERLASTEESEKA